MARPDDRIEALRRQVDQILRAQADDDERRCGTVHLYGVAQAAALLALRRGMDVSLALAAAMLHDIATYATGDSRDHARHGADMARSLLTALGDWSPDEVASICTAIARHSAKGDIDAPLDELLKDADVLQYRLYNPLSNAESAGSDRHARLVAVGQTLGFIDI